MSQRTKPVKIPRKCINKMGVLNVQRCNNIGLPLYYFVNIIIFTKSALEMLKGVNKTNKNIQNTYIR